MLTTTFAKPGQVARNWVLIDADGQILGRLASRIALMLRGKHKVQYTPHVDTGDFVVVINAEKIATTGKKTQQKVYQRYSGYPSGQKRVVMSDVIERHPDRVLRTAVKGMMPDGPLSRKMLKKLKIYAGPAHPHAAQQPTKLARV